LAARTAALAGWVPDVDAVAPLGDDGLDALAVAWSAWRWACGAAEVLGGELDEHGLPMRMVI
jgi:predicted RNase H-like nuclease